MATKMIILAILSAGAHSYEDGTSRYKFVQDTQRYVGFLRDNTLFVGKLDADGEFHLTRRAKAQVTPSFDGSPPNKTIMYSGPDHVMLNKWHSPPRKVYELRSGMLIPGTMQESGKFVPEEGGKIIKFSDYRYSPFARPIWNLPGRFVTEEEAAKLKRPKPAAMK